MKDRIIQGFLNDFISEYSLHDLVDTEAFEQFVNFCIISRIHSGTFDFEDIGVGDKFDSGIDGMAIIVNEHIVSSESDVDYFKEYLKRLDVRFVFIQSKTSQKFDMGDISKFLFGIRNFFEDSPSVKLNDKLQNLRKIKEYIYDSSIDMEHNPICDMYFVTTGQWKEDKNIVAVIQEGVKHMESTNLFSEVKFYPIVADYLKSIYRALRKKLVKEVNFEKHTILPKIDKVRTAYIGILPSSEYLKLICDAEGNLQRSLFYDNVRDYQGNNSVNQEIRETIETPELSDKFALLNNGITIVARSVNQTGTTFKIGDFQIVNGCQTSHVLYFNKESLSGEMYIPVKLIVTDDNETTNRIIQATNRQTEVKLEAFESLSDFHKQLEEFYATFDKETGKRLYYERRSKQYEYQPNVNKNQIISIATQAKCFLAMFLNGPHSTHRYYGNILKFNRNQIFNESHKMFPYYLSGFALHRLERLFYQKKIENHNRLFRYHLLMIFRLQNETAAIPPLNSQKIDQYCQELAEILWDEKAALKAFQKAVQILDNAFSQSNYSRVEAERRKVFTESLEKLVRQSNKSPHVGLTATVTRETGTVTEFSNIRGYGFISGDDGRNLFVHYSQIRGSGFRWLDIGARVSYVVVKTQKGVQAKDVILQDDKGS